MSDPYFGLTESMSESISSQLHFRRQVRWAVIGSALLTLGLASLVLLAHVVWPTLTTLIVGGLLSTTLTLTSIYLLASRLLRSGRQMMRQERDAQLEALRLATSAAESANEAKTRFLASMSHEIRTPMNGVLGLTTLLLESPLSDEQREDLRVVKSSAETLLVILNDVLDFSRLESDRFKFESIPFDLVELVQDVGDLMFTSAAAKQLEVGIRLSPDTPHRLIGDPVRVRQILLNLVNNALKFTSRGSVMIEVDVAQRTTSTVTLRFSVHDTGIGIRADALPSLFNRFVQADSSTTRVYGGTGLGLAICRQLVEKLGGTVTVQSEVGSGSSFHVRLPFPLARDRIDPERSAEDLHSITAMVICPNLTIGLIIEETLSNLGIDTLYGCGSDDIAVTFLGSLQSGVDLPVVLVDCEVFDSPEGDRIAGWLEQVRRTHDIRLLLLAPSGWKPAREHQSVRIDSIIRKPVLSPALQRALQRVRAESRTGPDPSAGEAAAANRPARAAVLRPPRILVVDDHPVNQLVARKLLEAMDCCVEVAADGRLAVAAVHEQDYDLILMDCSMPVMDGYDATRAIRRTPDRADTPIVAMTAHVLPGERERCLECGMNDYLTKPLKRSELEQILARYVRQPQPA